MLTPLGGHFPGCTRGWWAAALSPGPGSLPVALHVGGTINVSEKRAWSCAFGYRVASVETAALMVPGASVTDGLTAACSSAQAVGSFSGVSRLSRSSEISNACHGSGWP